MLAMIPTTLEYHQAWREFFRKYDHRLPEDVIFAYELDCMNGIWPPKEELPTEIDAH